MIAENLRNIRITLPEDVELVAVSKFHPVEQLLEAYSAGQRLFAESRPQELAMKYELLPRDTRWHFIGHLQSNKVREVVRCSDLIHSIDSLKLARCVSDEARRTNKVTRVLLQVHIAREESKQGFAPTELMQLIDSGDFAILDGIEIVGLMGMATFTDDESRVRAEFASLRTLYNTLRESSFPGLNTLSMGMSNDYHVAIAEGSNMVRIGSSIFGQRN